MCRPDIDDFAKAIRSVFEGKATILNRMRLSCMFHGQASDSTTVEGASEFDHLLVRRNGN